MIWPVGLAPMTDRLTPKNAEITRFRHIKKQAHNAHNHPSGIAEPSQADLRITQRLKDSLALIDVRVLDHIVVGEGEGVSLAERGLL